MGASLNCPAWAMSRARRAPGDNPMRTVHHAPRTRPGRFRGCMKSGVRTWRMPRHAALWAESRRVFSSRTVSLARPAHHAADGTFVNPWPSYREHGPVDFFTKALPEWRWGTSVFPLPVEPPPWPAIRAPTEALQALWVGHVTFLVQSGGWNVLTDPVFGARASPVQFAGPARYTPPACAVADLPPIHAVLISHNHYDHLCASSVRELLEREGGGATWWYCPLGVAPLMRSLGVSRDRVVELDWWQVCTLGGAPGGGLEGAASPKLPRTSAPRITAVPAQHQSARTAFDRNASLWCGYVVETPVEGDEPAPAAVEGGVGGDTARRPPPVSPGVRTWFFSGDTGYRSVPHGAQPYSAEEASSPACPAFKQIGAAFGGFDLSFLPIGAYSPRFFMSSFHASPEDAVEMHVDVQSRHSVGMHWGAFALTDEPVEEPPERLARAVARKGLPPHTFVAVRHGQVVAPGRPGGVLPSGAPSLTKEVRGTTGEELA